MKRLTLSGKVKQIPRSKDETYVYMDVDSDLSKKGMMWDHCLKIVDCYYAFKKPKMFEVEKEFGCYKPDVYTMDKNGNLMCVEIQITKVGNKRMQEKANKFCKEVDKHRSKIFVIISDYDYKIDLPYGFYVKRFPMVKEYVV